MKTISQLSPHSSNTSQMVRGVDGGGGRSLDHQMNKWSDSDKLHFIAIIIVGRESTFLRHNLTDSLSLLKTICHLPNFVYRSFTPFTPTYTPSPSH